MTGSKIVEVDLGFILHKDPLWSHNFLELSLSHFVYVGQHRIAVHDTGEALQLFLAQPSRSHPS